MCLRVFPYKLTNKMEVMNTNDRMINLYNQGKFSIATAKNMRISEDSICNFIGECIQNVLLNEQNNEARSEYVFEILANNIKDLDMRIFNIALQKMKSHIIVRSEGVLKCNRVVLPPNSAW